MVWKNKTIVIQVWTVLTGMCQTCQGIAFTAYFLNQASTTIHIYTDGSVLVSHGGIEMGQGLNTKVAQVVADGKIKITDYIIVNF